MQIIVLFKVKFHLSKNKINKAINLTEEVKIAKIEMILKMTPKRGIILLELPALKIEEETNKGMQLTTNKIV
jgi:hypothetical protein